MEESKRENILYQLFRSRTEVPWSQIIERGTHRELMELDGQYAEMFRCQAKYYQDINIP